MGVDQNRNDKQSCLKKNPETAARVHRATSSQVRFSLPPEEDDSITDEKDVEYEGSNFYSDAPRQEGKCNNGKPLLQSPNRIVFPNAYKDAEDVPGFVDYTNKTTVRVPKDIWDFHNRNSYDFRKNGSWGGSSHSVSLSGSPMKSHSRRNSMQSIIMETIENYRHGASPKKTGDLGNTPSLLPCEDKKANLYLGSDSPMNRYEVPIPLEIKVPPYLSPVNKHKRRNSLVFDGDGYSVYLADESSPSDTSSRTSENEDDVFISSDISIPSAENNFSFNLSDGDVDAQLGIDGDANVNLKKQVKNLKKLTSSSQNQNFDLQKPLPLVSQPETISENSSHALEVLATPTKEIFIPDVDSITTSSGKRSSSKFLETIINSPSENIQLNPVMLQQEQDELNPNFKFPNVTGNISENSEFLNMPLHNPDSPTERRRRYLAEQNERMGHTHRRSRSVHQMDIESLKEIKTPEKSKDIKEIILPVDISTPEIPLRSPLRPKTSGSSLNNNNDNNNNNNNNNNNSLNFQPSSLLSTEDLTSIHSVGGKVIEDSIENSSEYSNNSQFSFANSINAENSKHTEKETNFGNDNEIHFDEKVGTFATVYSSCSKDSNSNKISSEVKPLSTIQSFRDEFVPPTMSAYIPGFQTRSNDIKSRKGSLDPARKLSNNCSHSSYESEMSLGSHPSVGTTITEVSVGKSNLVTSKMRTKPSAKETDTYLAGIHSKLKDSTLIDECGGKGNHLEVENYKTILEEVDGKLVEMILIDEPIKNTTTISSTQQRFSEKKKRRSAELGLLCEQTASEIKDVIKELTACENPKNTENISKPLPPIPHNILSQHRLLHKNGMSSHNRRRYMERVSLKNGTKV